MDEIHSDEPEGAPERAPNAGAGAPSGGAGPERRFSARRKLAAVMRLLRASRWRPSPVSSTSPSPAWASGATAPWPGRRRR